MKRQRISTISLLLALVMAASLCVSPIADAQPAVPQVVPGVDPEGAAMTPENVQANPPLLNIVQVVAGGRHTCALTSGGGVKCWGDNESSQAGDGTSFPFRYTPVDVVGLASGVTALAAGMYHTCALTNAGGVKCWGTNYFGQLGDGTTADRKTPVNVQGLSSGVIGLAAGGVHTCALMSSGGVKCWGANYAGQIGDGTTTDRYTPVEVSGLSGVMAVTGGWGHTCALTNGGGLKCWGGNGGGQLGDGTTTDRLAPVDVTGLGSGVTAVDAGGAHTCAVKSSGKVNCWGAGISGQLGDGTHQQRTTPVEVKWLDGAVHIAAGSAHTCAVTNSGGVKCWGWNGNGQLGDGTTTIHGSPVNVVGLDGGITAVAAGELHTCAVTSAGGLKCWGHNGNGQIADGTYPVHTVPVDLPGVTGGVTAMAGGWNHACFLTAAGGVKCWGNNGDGQLGDGTNTNRSSPVDVIGLTSGVTAVSAGAYHTCALTTAGGIKCWGANSSNQLGDGTATSRSSPVDVSGLTSGVAAVAAGGLHTCALTNAGGVKCWGSNNSGQVGDGTTTSRSTPGDVIGLSSGVQAVVAGWTHTCAVTNAGAVKCWGENDSGQLGDGTYTNRNTPVTVSGLTSGVAALTAGIWHTCALTTSGGVKCWGTGDGGTPRDVIGLTSGVAAVKTGGIFTCVLTTAGGVKCWGDSTAGQCGDGTGLDGRDTPRPTPVDVIGLNSGVTALATGYTQSCALVGDGRPKCWGWDLSWGRTGMLGIHGERLTPMDVVVAIAPTLSVNYAAGRPGSFITLTGSHFPGVTPLSLSANGVALATTPATSEIGEFVIFLDTTAAGEGFYTITADSNPELTVSFVLDPNAPLRVQEGGGTTFAVPGGIALPVIRMYMPLMQR